MFVLSVYGRVAPRFKFCDVVAGFLGAVLGWVEFLSLCSLPFLRGEWLPSKQYIVLTF